MRSAAVQIVVPFYRAGAFLRDAIESVFQQQDFDDWHLCLVNDASDENDVQIAHEFHRAFPDKVTLLQHSGSRPRGTSAARNLGIRSSASEFIAFLDADDTWYRYKLKSQVDLLKGLNGVDMVYGPALRWYSWNGGQDVEVAVNVDGYGTDCTVPGRALLDTYLRDEAMTPCTGSVLLRRQAVLGVGGFEEQFHDLYDDQVFYAKLCLNSRVYVSSHCVSRYRQHADSCCRRAEVANTGEAARARFLDWLKTYREARDIAGTEPALSPRELLAT